jgi:hypothetical protein
MKKLCAREEVGTRLGQLDAIEDGGPTGFSLFFKNTVVIRRQAMKFKQKATK